MQAQPRRTHHPIGGAQARILRSTVAVKIRIMVSHKALAAVHLLSGLHAVRLHPLYKIKQRHVTFREITYLRGPVVHLSIDIDRILRTPHGIEVFVPDTLKVKRLASFSASGDHEIASEVEIEFDKLVIVDKTGTLLVIKFVTAQTFDTLIGRK